MNIHLCARTLFFLLFCTFNHLKRPQIYPVILFSIKETIHSKMRVQSVSANVKVNSGEVQSRQ